MLNRPSEYALEVTEQTAQRMAAIARSEVQGYQDVILNIGTRSVMGFLGASRPNKSTITVHLPQYALRIDDSDRVKEKLRAHFDEFPGATFAFGGLSPFSLLAVSSTRSAHLGRVFLSLYVSVKPPPWITKPGTTRWKMVPL